MNGIAKLVVAATLLLGAYLAFNTTQAPKNSNEVANNNASELDDQSAEVQASYLDSDSTEPNLLDQEAVATRIPRVTHAVYETDSSVVKNGVIIDSQIRLCQGYSCPSCASTQACGCQAPVMAAPACNTCPPTGEVVLAGGAYDTGAVGFAGGDIGYLNNSGGSGKWMVGVDGNTRSRNGREPRWRNAGMIPWEEFAYGEYIGPHRTPHVQQYRVRVGDTLEFVYLMTRERSAMPYRLYVGDTLQISSAGDPSLNQTGIQILSDGTISVTLIGQVRVAGKTVADIQRELNDRYSKLVKNPAIVVQVLTSETPLSDLRDAVDARAGTGGQSRQAIVSPDGTVQLPMIGSIPAVGLSLEEVGREVNARYRMRIRGIEVTPILLQRASRFIYVVGEVAQPGRFELVGPTTAIQSLALAQGFNPGGNLRQIVVLRRDQNWRLVATKIDLAGVMNGRKPYPSDEIWLRHDDIVIVPKKPIQRLSEAINQYFSTALFGVFPGQLGSFDAAAVVQ